MNYISETLMTRHTLARRGWESDMRKQYGGGPKTNVSHGNGVPIIDRVIDTGMSLWNFLCKNSLDVWSLYLVYKAITCVLFL